MEKKFKIKIIVTVVAVIAAFILVGTISGFFAYLFTGYKAFFKKDAYTVRQPYVNSEYEVSVADGKIDLTTKSTFSSTELKGEVLVSVSEKGGKKQIVLTFKNHYSISGGTLFSGLCLEDARRKGNAPFDDFKRTTEVFLLDGGNKIQCPLASYTRNRKTLKMYYSVDGDVDIDKILVSGFWLTEAKRK